jgi:hypothetical protein
MRLLLDEQLDGRLKRFFGEEYEVVNATVPPFYTRSVQYAS